MRKCVAHTVVLLGMGVILLGVWACVTPLNTEGLLCLVDEDCHPFVCRGFRCVRVEPKPVSTCQGLPQPPPSPQSPPCNTASSPSCTICFPSRQILTLPQAQAHALAYHPNGRWLLVSSTEELALWDIQDAKKIRTYAQEPSQFSAVAFSPNGLFMVAARHSHVVLWDQSHSMENPLHSWPNHHNVPSLLVAQINQNPVVIFGDHNGQIHQWNHATKQMLSQAIYDESIQTLAIFPSKRQIAVAYESSRVHLLQWFNDSEPLLKTVQNFFTEPWGIVDTMQFSEDGNELLLGTRLARIGKLRLQDGQRTLFSHHHSAEIRQLVRHPSGKLMVSVALDGAILFWQLSEERPVYCIQQEQQSVWSAAFSPDGRRLALATSTGIHLWECPP